MSRNTMLKAISSSFFKNPRYFTTKVSQKLVKSHENLVKNVTHTRDFLILEKNTKESFKYPLVWLRDNCQCESCFHKHSHSRTINWETFDLDQHLVEVTHSDEGLVLRWNDGHKSIFHEKWLLERNFSEENRKKYLSEDYRPLKTPFWGKHDFDLILKRFNYNEVINSDEGLFNWLDTLSRVGIGILTDTPLNRTECRKLANRVGFIRKTHYGEEFEVIAKEGTSNVAYLSSALQLHTDLPYYEYKPGVNLLHCLVQSKSEGGHNQITDGFYVASLMQKHFPEYFKILSETLVNWSDIGEENGNKFHSVYRAPVITLNKDKTFARINHSVPQRDSVFSIPVEDVQTWYLAMKKFVEIVHEETVTFKTKPGEILTFDNIRLIHGRTGYTDDGCNTRHLIGSYLDWDEIYSRLRVLRKELKR